MSQTYVDDPDFRLTPGRARGDVAGLFLKLILAYVLIQTIAIVPGFWVFKLLGHAMAVGMLCWLAVVWMTMPVRKDVPAPVFYLLLVFYYGLFGSVVYHRLKVDVSDLIKISIVPLYVLLGIRVGSFRGEAFFARKWWPKICFSILVVLPLFTWAVQLLIKATDFGAGQVVAFFANRNNAALYFVTLLAFYNAVAEKPVKKVWLILFCGAAFGALGVFLAVLCSLVVSTGRWGLLKNAFWFGPVVATVWFFYPDISVFERFYVVYDSLVLVLSGGISLHTVTYGDLVMRLGSSDLSFIFRLKHWLDLLSIYVDSDFYGWMFGFGIGSAAKMSFSQLVPHNDYLRILFEAGFVAFFGFVGLVSYLLIKLRGCWSVIPLLAISFYFFTENLINNYVAMALFFYSAGVLFKRKEIGGVIE